MKQGIKLFFLLIISLVSCTVTGGREAEKLPELTQATKDQLLEGVRLEKFMERSERLSLNPIARMEDGNLIGRGHVGEKQTIQNSNARHYYMTNNEIELVGYLDQWVFFLEKTASDRTTLKALNIGSYQVFLIEEQVTDLMLAAQFIVVGDDLYYIKGKTREDAMVMRYDIYNQFSEVYRRNTFYLSRHQDQMHYLYLKNDKVGYESATMDGKIGRIMTPEYANIYALFFTQDQLNLLTNYTEGERHYEMRLKDAFGNSEVENFSRFFPKFQDDDLVVGHNGRHDILFYQEKMTQIPAKIVLNALFEDKIFYTIQQDGEDQYYSILKEDVKKIINE